MLLAWIAAACITLALSLLLMLHSESTESTGASTFSRSAIGHAGIAEILRQRGINVISSKGDSLHKLAKDGLLVLAEPDFAGPNDRTLDNLLRGRDVLLVLPKWRGRPDRRGRGWIETAEPVPMLFVRSVLESVVRPANLDRVDGAVAWTHNLFAITPHLTAPAQLLPIDDAPRITPLIEGDRGILLGGVVRNGLHIWLLTDPDVISNHGLAEGNAALAVAIFDAISDGGPVVFDETIHGFSQVPTNPMKLLLRQPFATVVLQAAAAATLLLWAAAARFGAPEQATPPLGAGKRELVANVARLFNDAGYHDTIVRRYVEETMRDVALKLHVPTTLDNAATLGWLRDIGAARRVTIDCADVGTRAATLTAAHRQSVAALMAMALEISVWKREMLDGTARGAGSGGGDSRRGPQGGGRAG